MFRLISGVDGSTAALTPGEVAKYIQSHASVHGRSKVRFNADYSTVSLVCGGTDASICGASGSLQAYA